LPIQVLGRIAPVLARIDNIGQHRCVDRWHCCSDNDRRHGGCGECKRNRRRGGCGSGRNDRGCVRGRDNGGRHKDSDSSGCRRGRESRGCCRGRAGRCRGSERHDFCWRDCQHGWHDRLHWHTLRGLDRWLKHRLWRSRYWCLGRNGLGGHRRWRWCSATGHQCRYDNPCPVPSLAVLEATMNHGVISSAGGLLICFWPINAADCDAEHTGLVSLRPACHTGFIRDALP
jgi:hypothetical protein